MVPNISFSDEDQEAWTDNEVSVNFEAVDNESGIDHCEWAIGMFCFHISSKFIFVLSFHNLTCVCLFTLRIPTTRNRTAEFH